MKPTKFNNISQNHTLLQTIQVQRQVSLATTFSDINISQGSIAMHLRCGWVINDPLVANILLSVPVK